MSDSDSVDILRDDLRSLYQWSEDWQMLFNIDKCKVMHFGTNNRREKYSINNTVLNDVKEERDLGVIVQNDLKVSMLKSCKNRKSCLGYD